MTDHVYPTAEPLEAAVIAALQAEPTTPLERFLQHTVRGLAAGVSGKDPNVEPAVLAEGVVEDAWVDSAEDTDFPYDDEDDAAAKQPVVTFDTGVVENGLPVVASSGIPDDGTRIIMAPPEAATAADEDDEDEWLTGAACSREDPECEACQ